MPVPRYGVRALYPILAQVIRDLESTGLALVERNHDEVAVLFPLTLRGFRSLRSALQDPELRSNIHFQELLRVLRDEIPD
jgi:hypothetical protein